LHCSRKWTGDHTFRLFDAYSLQRLHQYSKSVHYTLNQAAVEIGLAGAVVDAREAREVTILQRGDLALIVFTKLKKPSSWNFSSAANAANIPLEPAWGVTQSVAMSELLHMTLRRMERCADMSCG
jgi:hypothetical protein